MDGKQWSFWSYFFQVLPVFLEVCVHCMCRSIKFSLMHRTAIITTISIHKSFEINLIYAQLIQNFLLPGKASSWSLHMYNLSANQSNFGPLLSSQFLKITTDLYWNFDKLNLNDVCGWCILCKCIYSTI